MQNEKARLFTELHKPGEPLILFNAWDPGSAKVIADAGAPAIATGSWSVAAAFGFEDGETLPFDLAMGNLERIVSAVELPVTVDLEGGYGRAPADVAATARRAIAAGAIGCNLEDQMVGGDGLYPIDDQCERLQAVRAAANETGIPFFINARTDLFLKARPEEHGGLIKAALDRGRAYAEAGASGLFVPGLADEDLIAGICSKAPLPVNIMAFPGVPPARRLARLGVARISHGPGPYRLAMQALAKAARAAHKDV
jgi:2-methylisocitrate lyase-like PEP mutase family enzyme